MALPTPSGTAYPHTIIILICSVKQLASYDAKDYTHHMADEIKSERITILLSPSELKELDDWSFDRRIRSRSEAIRQLTKLGLESTKKPQKAKA